MVPPVASRSSTSSTRAPALTPSMWTCSSALPYSRSYFKRVGAVRQLARLAQRHERLLRRRASGAANRKPRASAAATASIGRPRYCVVQAGRSTSWKASRLGQQRRDVLEQDARLGKIRDVADILRQVHAGVSRGAWGQLSLRASRQGGNHVRRCPPGRPPADVAGHRRVQPPPRAKKPKARRSTAVLVAGVVAGLADPHKGPYFVAEEAGRDHRAAHDHLRVERLAQRLDVVDSERLRPRRGPAARRLPRAVPARSSRRPEADAGGRSACGFTSSTPIARARKPTSSSA